jgi:hypothetical protein
LATQPYVYVSKHYILLDKQVQFYQF